MFWVYIMSNASMTLYTGFSNDLPRRVYEHKNKVSQGFTARYHFDRLVYFEEFVDVRFALMAEKKIKTWSRGRKIELVKENNPGWIDLSADWELGKTFKP